MIKTNELRIRDPYVVAYKNEYYMYKSYVENNTPYIVYSLDWPHNYDEKEKCVFTGPRSHHMKERYF